MVAQSLHLASTEEQTFCHSSARQFFVEQLPRLHTTEGLARAAIAIAMHALEDADPRRVEQRLAALARRVVARSPSRRPAAVVANLHAVLFEDEGFLGEHRRYYNALNSYLPAVLTTRCGLPATLSLVYKLVGTRAGLTIEGINAPGHFLVRVQCDNAWMIVDPFFGGQMLTREEAFARLDRVARRRLPRCEEFLATATHVQWITRILENLRQLFSAEGRLHDLAAMTELRNLLVDFERAKQQNASLTDTVTW